MALTLVAVGVVPVISAVRAADAGWQPVGDVALILTRADSVLDNPPGVGQPTTSDTLGAGVETAHPGPIESYLLAPGVALAGPRIGALATLAILHAVVLLSALVLAFRRGGPVLLVATAVVVLLVARAADPSQLHDPINSDLATTALVPLLLAAWSLGEGDTAWTPWFVFLSALVAQPHLSNLPFAVAVTGGGVVALILALRAGRVGSARYRVDLVAGAVVALVVWVPVVADQLIGGGNLVALARASGGDRTTVGPWFGLGTVADAVAPKPLPAFASAATRLAPNGLPPVLILLLGCVVVGLAGAAALAVRDRGDRATPRLLVLALVGTGAGALGTARLPWTGVVRVDMVRWLLASTAVTWLGLALAAWRAAPATWRTRWGLTITSIGVSLVVVIAAAVSASPPLRQNSGAWYMARSEGFVEAIAAKVPPGRYLVQPVGATALLTVVPNLALELDGRGRRLVVVRVAYTRGFAPRHLVDADDLGQLDGRLVVLAVGEGEVPAGADLVARSEAPQDARGESARTLEAWVMAP